MPLFKFPRCVQLEKLTGNLFGGTFHPCFDALPGLTAHLIDDRLDALHPHILLDHIHSVYRQIEFVPILVDQFQKIIGDPVYLQLYQASIAPDTMLNVYDQIALFQILQIQQFRWPIGA